MIEIGENYKLVNDLLSKNNGVYITPDEYIRYATVASNEYFDSLIGADNQPRSVYGRNRTLDQRLRVFRKESPLPVVSGTVDIPEDLAIITAVYTQDYIPLRSIDEDRLARIMQDPLADPQLDDPLYIEGSTVLRVYPDGIPSVTLEYLKTPTPPVYGYDVVNRRAVYNPLTSVHFEWDKREESELTMRILQFCGVSMGNGEIAQFAGQKQNEE